MCPESQQWDNIPVLKTACNDRQEGGTEKRGNACDTTRGIINENDDAVTSTFCYSFELRRCSTWPFPPFPLFDRQLPTGSFIAQPGNATFDYVFIGGA